MELLDWSPAESRCSLSNLGEGSSGLGVRKPLPCKLRREFLCPDSHLLQWYTNCLTTLEECISNMEANMMGSSRRPCWPVVPSHVLPSALWKNMMYCRSHCFLPPQKQERNYNLLSLCQERGSVSQTNSLRDNDDDTK